MTDDLGNLRAQGRTAALKGYTPDLGGVLGSLYTLVEGIRNRGTTQRLYDDAKALAIRSEDPELKSIFDEDVMPLGPELVIFASIKARVLARIAVIRALPAT